MKKTILTALVIACGVISAVAQDGIVNGVHGYTPKSYVHPTDPVIKERLEWFMDQKLALMMHFGLYSVGGVRESWPLSDEDGHKWSRSDVDWTKDDETFKKWYIDLIGKFDPVRLNPDVWAKEAFNGGFRYLIFTTKHHDGFCLFDSKYSDYKTTSPKCPFSDDPRADIVRTVFDAFRAKDIPVVAYFSKPDW
ncbi:MAG: alpha-L-fucosidase, partial [Kiritimatiellae bacterium]|nr:alpha-L-fucosidase [Kiritimatiellia bacterium]